MAKQKHIWDRWIEKGEGPKSYDLFLQFLELGSARDFSLVIEKTSRKQTVIYMLSSKFQWRKRAQAYDTHLLNVQRKAIEATVKTEAIIWGQREVEHRHRAYDFALKLFEKAQQMLATPLYEEIIDTFKSITVNGETIEVPTKIIVKPVRWNFKTMADIGELSDKLMRLALGVPTSRSALEVNVNNDDPEERLIKAKETMKVWRETRLEGAVQQVLLKDPSQDPELVRAQLLAAAPTWFGHDFKVDPVLLLNEEVEDNTPPPLQLEAESSAVN